MGRLMRRLYSVVSFVLVLATVLLAVLLVGVRLVGLEPYTVLSGSMEPNYHVGSLLYIQKVDPNTLQAGDPVTYYMNGSTVVTHRVVEVVEDPELGRCYRTRGDANNMDDGRLLSPSNVIGKPLFSIPYLGYVSSYVQNPPGTYVAIAACCIFLSMSMLTDFLFPAAQNNEPEQESEPEQEIETEDPPKDSV